MPLGISTTLALTQVSTREEKLKSGVVSGHGSPTHTPEVPYQRYYDIDGAATWEWVQATWNPL